MNKEEIAKLTFADIETIFGPAIPEPSMGNMDDVGVLFEPNLNQNSVRYNPNNLTKEDEDAIIDHIYKNLIGVYIKELYIEKQHKHLNSSGEDRKISIKGNVGAKFTVTVKDSLECSIMDKELELVEIPSSGIYVFNQKFPSINSGKKEDFYEVKIIPHATVKTNGSLDFKIFQYPTPTITFSAPMVSIQQVIATGRTAGDVDSTLSKKGNDTSSNSNFSNNRDTWTTVVSESGDGTHGHYYVKSIDFSKATTKSSVIKKTLVRASNNPTDQTLNLKPLKTGVKNGLTSGDLKVGMIIRGRVEKRKKVLKSLEVPSCKQKTNKFELENTIGLFEGMHIYTTNNSIQAHVVSIDCGKNITISKKLIINKNDTLRFEHLAGGRVSSITSQYDKKGNACVVIDGSTYMPDGMVLEFDGDTSSASGKIKTTGSGTSSVTISSEINIKDFGTEDVTFTLDLASLLSRKPNARDLNFIIDKNTVGVFNLSVGDFDANKLTKQHTITKSASYGSSTYTAYQSDGYKYPFISYTPIRNFVGDDVIKYRVTHDGTHALVDNSKATNPMSDEKTIRITVK